MDILIYLLCFILGCVVTSAAWGVIIKLIFIKLYIKLKEGEDV